MAMRYLFLWLASVLLVQATHEADIVHFKTVTSPWSSCYRLNSSLSCYRTREAVCVRSRDNLTAPWYYCTDRGVQRTATVEVCKEEGACQQGCAATQWSTWSNCDCSQNFYSNRTREVISPARNGGLACPALLERKVCLCARNELFDTQPRKHTWNTDKWGPCTALNTSSQCGVGLRSRAVICENLEGMTVDIDNCLQEYAYSSLVPPSSQTHCELPCPCLLGEWGAFSSCITQCEQQTPTGLKTRSRPVLQHQTIGLSCENTLETMPCTPTENSCPVYIWNSSSWSACSVQSNAICGDGHTTRFVYCLEVWNGTTRTVDHSKCEVLANISRPAEVMTCSVTCPQACLVGEWSEWSQCPRACHLTYKNRTRSVIVPPLLDNVCPYLLELVRCPILPCARWLPGEYSKCTPLMGTCGNGFQSRTVSCVGPSDDAISAGACEHLVRPTSTITCHMPCPNDCVISDWSKWSSCSETCGGRVGNQTRTRDFVAGGLTCPYNDGDLLETRNCSSDEDCVPVVFHLKQLAWGMCAPESATLNSSTSPPTDNLSDGFGSSCAVMGTRNRSSVCMQGEQAVPAMQCPIEFHLQVEPCVLACSRECVYSEWSPFSECLCNMGMGHRKRSRHLIQFSSSGSTACTVDENGLEVETEMCSSMCDVPAVVMGWETSEWSQCHVYQGISPQGQCGIGYRNRTVSCVAYGTELMVAESQCLSMEGMSRPTAVSSCHVECKQRCLVTEWSQLSGCMHGGNRTRQRAIVPYRDCNNWELCCPDLASISLHESIPCPSSVPQMNVYEYITSSYSSCILDSPQATCGNGRKYRKNLCVYLALISSEYMYQPVDDAFCKLAGTAGPEESQACNIKCERDCIQNDWMPWSSCSISCGGGYRTRSRTTLTSPEVGGRPCGSSLETDVCFSSPCPRVEILPGPFGACVPSNVSLSCGDGVRVRELVCLVDGVTHDLGECTSVGVANSFPVSEACVAPCPGKCVVGEWGQWSPCSINCPSGSCQRTRTRAILRETESCSESVQELQICYAPVNPYAWTIGPWKDCILDSSETSVATAPSLRGHYCGEGVRRRVISCANVTESVHKSFCLEAGLRSPETEESCSLPCPIDCKVGGFSDWTECEACNLHSSQRRERRVIVAPQFGGQMCPHLEQTNYCAPTGCVIQTLINHTSLETVDYTRDGQCGYALKLEPQSCLRNTEFVYLSECLDGATVMAKYVPLLCPREPNCTYSEWSGWSDCVTLSTDPGRSFRHRYHRLISSHSNLTSACSAAQNQIDKCQVEPENWNRTEIWNGTEMFPTTAKPIGAYIDFIWHTSRWNGNGRDVYCQSSTGIRVGDEGCPYSIMPRSQNKTCVNVTCSDYATCNDSEGVCLQTCEANFEPVGITCLPRSGCKDHTHCLIPNMACSYISGSCECKEGHQRSEAGECVLAPTATIANAPDVTGSSGIQLGVLYISLISAVPLLTVIVLVVALIVIMYICVKKLEPKEVQHDLKHRRLKVSISSPREIAGKFQRSEEDSNPRTYSNSNGFVDGIDTFHLHRYGPPPTSVLGGEPGTRGSSNEPDVPRYTAHPSAPVHPIPIAGPISPGYDHRSTPNSPTTHQPAPHPHRGNSLPYLSNLPNGGAMLSDTTGVTDEETTSVPPSSIGSPSFYRHQTKYDSMTSGNSYNDMHHDSPVYARVQRSWNNAPLERESPCRSSRRESGSRHSERDNRIAVGLDSGMLHAVNQLGAEMSSLTPSSQHSYSSDCRMSNHRCYHGSQEPPSCCCGDGINHSIAHLPNDYNHMPSGYNSEGYRSKSMPRAYIHIPEQQQLCKHSRHGYMNRPRDYHGDGEYPCQGQRAQLGEERQAHQQNVSSRYRSPRHRSNLPGHRPSFPVRRRHNSTDTYQDSSDNCPSKRSPPHQYRSLHSCEVSTHRDNHVPHRYLSHRRSSPAINCYYYGSEPPPNFSPPMLQHGNQPKRMERNGFDTYDYPSHCQPQDIHKLREEAEREKNSIYAIPRPINSLASAPVTSRQEKTTSIYDYPRPRGGSTSTHQSITSQQGLVEDRQASDPFPNVVVEQPAKQLSAQPEHPPTTSDAYRHPTETASPQGTPMASGKCHTQSPPLSCSKFEDTSGELH